jgi:hypothetical protein
MITGIILVFQHKCLSFWLYYIILVGFLLLSDIVCFHSDEEFLGIHIEYSMACLMLTLYISTNLTLTFDAHVLFHTLCVTLFYHYFHLF